MDYEDSGSPRIRDMEEEISSLEPEQLLLFQHLLTPLMTEKEKLDEEIDLIQNEYDDLKIRYDTVVAQGMKVETQLEEAHSESQQQHQQIIHLEEQVDHLQADVRQHLMEIDSNNMELTHLRDQTKQGRNLLHEAEIKIQQLEHKLRQQQDHQARSHEKTASKYDEELTRRSDEIFELRTKLSTCQDNLKRYQSDFTMKEKETDQLKKDKAADKRIIDTLKKKLRVSDTAIEKLESIEQENHTLLADNDAFRQALEEVENRLDALQEEYAEEQDWTAHLRRENEKLQLQVDQLQVTGEERLENEKKLRSLWKQMQDDQESRNAKIAPEFFQMCVASNKISLAEKFDCNRVSDVNAEELWKMSQEQLIPMHEYWDWIKQYLLDYNEKQRQKNAAAAAVPRNTSKKRKAEVKTKLPNIKGDPTKKSPRAERSKKGTPVKPKAVPSKPKEIIRWQVHAGKQGFLNYPESFSQRLEMMYQEGATGRSIRWVRSDGVRYSISLKKMVQTNLKAKTERKIRRLVETEEPEEAGSWFSRLKKTLNWEG